jgi:predicted MFS family arabinose efflux permease
VPLAARAPFALLAALVLVRFADEWFTFFPAGALESIRDDLGLSYAEMGLVLTALPGGGLVGNAFALAADFVDRRWLAALGAAAYGVCLLAFGFGGSFVVLLVAAFAWGAASDAFVHGLEVALVDLCRGDVAPALARVNAYAAVGDLLGPLTLAAAAELGLGWRGAFGVGGALMLGYAAWIAGQRFPPPSRSSGTTVGEAVLAAVRDRRLLLLAVVDGLYGLLDEPFLGFAAAFLRRERGEDEAVATLAVGAAVVAGIVGYAVVPVVARRTAGRRVLAPLALILVLSIASLLVAPDVTAQALALGVFGLAGAVFYSLEQATYLSLRPGFAGTSQAVVATIGHFAIAFPALVGAVADAHGLAAGLAVYATVPVLILVLLVAGRVDR